MIVIGVENLQTGDYKLDKALAQWRKVAEEANWQSFNDVRKTYKSADCVAGITIFDILHNRFRLMTVIQYAMKTVRVRDVLTHAAYERWGKR